MGKDNIQITVRVRPLLAFEGKQDLCVESQTKDKQIKIIDPDNKNKGEYKFNHCFWS